MRPKVPELVDIKITDYCDIGCSFCYQDSTREGVHADKKSVYELFSYSWEIFEFAIGGGEPTTHPDFTEIIRRLSAGKQNFVNFTTRSTKWFDDIDIVRSVRRDVSGVAYSVNDAKEMEKFIVLHRKYFEYDVELYFHVIPELIGAEKFKQIIAVADELNKGEYHRNRKIHITALGFKETGRADGMEKDKMPGLVELVTSSTRTPIGVDTKIAKDYEEELRVAGVYSKLYTTREGEFSMYYDAVEQKAYKSSYELDRPVDVFRTDDNSRWGPRLKKLRDIFDEVRVYA